MAGPATMHRGQSVTRAAYPGLWAALLRGLGLGARASPRLERQARAGGVGTADMHADRFTLRLHQQSKAGSCSLQLVYP
ncbi:hypothetical protein HaLaN_31496, partial [Haematococcus lacustris]